MTHREKDTVVIVATASAECTQCFEVKELRPYGKEGAYICFQCGMQDESEMREQLGRLLDGSRDI